MANVVLLDWPARVQGCSRER
ncbi:MAG: hypothetical protein JWN14_1048, partial [Chthonomonadales bacterium]|nr:hypothetical protein [Chthonomonadales bacterium]